MLKPRPLPRHENCDCPKAIHRHGERTTYVVHKCRCDACREDNTESMRRLRRDKLYGRHWLVDAEPVRQHLRWLSSQGMGWKPAARAAGVATSTAHSILYGKLLTQPGHPEHRPPRKKVSKAVADRILAVQPTLQDGAIVNPVGTRRRIQALVARGWSLSQLAKRLGVAPTNFSRSIYSSGVLEGTRKAVAALYEQLWDQEPPTGTRWEKIAATKARRYAAERGWLPPMAWDDDTIDDPTTQPTTSDDDPTVDPADELRWLLDQYENPQHAAERLGITRNTLQARMRRWNVDYPPHMAAWIRDQTGQEPGRAAA